MIQEIRNKRVEELSKDKEMKKYYCPVCRKFKSRLQLKRVDDTRVSWLTCRWCHSSNIYTAEDLLNKLIQVHFTEEDLNSRHGSFL